jgi:hypothetical protein
MARKKSTELGGAIDPRLQLEDLRRRRNAGEKITTEEKSKKSSKSKRDLDALLQEQQAKEDAAAIASDVANRTGKRATVRTAKETGLEVKESTRTARRRPQVGTGSRRVQSEVDRRKLASITTAIAPPTDEPTSKPKKGAAADKGTVPSGPRTFGAVDDAPTPKSSWASKQAELNTAGLPSPIPAGEEYKLDEAYRMPIKGSRPGSFGGVTANDNRPDPLMSPHLQVLHGLASKLTEHLNTMHDVAQRTVPGAYYENLNDLTKVSADVWHHLGMAALKEGTGEVTEASEKALRTNPFRKPTSSSGLTDAQKMYESPDSSYRDALRGVPAHEVMTGNDDINSATTAVDHARLAVKHIGTLAAGLEALSSHISSQPVPVDYFAKAPAKKSQETDVAGFGGQPISVPALPTFRNSVSLKSGKTMRYGEAAHDVANKYELAAVEQQANPENREKAVSLAAWRQNNPFGDTAKLAEREAEQQAHEHQQRIELGLPAHSRLTIGGKLLSNTEEADYRATQPQTKAPMGAVGPLFYASGKPTASQGMSFVGPPSGMDRDHYHTLVSELVREGKLHPSNILQTNWTTSLKDGKTSRKYTSKEDIQGWHDFITKEYEARGGQVGRGLTAGKDKSGKTVYASAADATKSTEKFEAGISSMLTSRRSDIEDAQKNNNGTGIAKNLPGDAWPSWAGKREPGRESLGMPVEAPQAPKTNEFTGLAAGRGVEGDISSSFTPVPPSRRSIAATAAKAAVTPKTRVNASGVRLLTAKEYSSLDGDFNVSTGKFTYSKEDRPAAKLYENASRQAKEHWDSFNMAPPSLKQAFPNVPVYTRGGDASVGRLDLSKADADTIAGIQKLNVQQQKHARKFQSSLAYSDPHAYLEQVNNTPAAPTKIRQPQPLRLPGEAPAGSRAAKNMAAFRGE